ncbi:MAG TPA: choice-of-anchor V domain-containing protein [Thermoplasmata archaeon]|nr:choice-of-anchor V domain-containing protein [Thermoplasmata archaeon]
MGARRPARRGLSSGRAGRIAFGVAAFLGVLVVFVGAPTTDLPTGPPAEAMAKGCYCHNAAPSSDVRAAIGGIPAIYDGGTTYKLHIAILGGPEPSKIPGARQGGFILGTTQGALAPLTDDDTVKVSDDTTTTNKVQIGEHEMAMISIVTQSDAGNKQREWNVEWAAPSTPEGKTFFVLVVNSVNGVGGADPLDQWTRTIAVSAGPGEPSATVPIHEMGVPLMAYWLGVIGFIIILVTMGFGYILVRRGSEHYKFPDVPQGKRVLSGRKKS